MAILNTCFNLHAFLMKGRLLPYSVTLTAYPTPGGGCMFMMTTKDEVMITYLNPLGILVLRFENW